MKKFVVLLLMLTLLLSILLTSFVTRFNIEFNTIELGVKIGQCEHIGKFTIEDGEIVRKTIWKLC